ncbi:MULTISPECIES: DUF6022 family protein [Paenibacillus]|uniref:Uncharacterized protein n=1 Tax=Paenibacillus campinasensis TaxID=66347 RepID=A0ABW9T5X5_9BACL|nr:MULTISPECIES: DUF6022 family protein [Paenibacillus]MUG68504.1 hypothetical protein [Paenibacillus campinasensis]PAK47985.1 hypothetical protein CHH75_23610 [Paenibacillus sp. 7541]
MTSIQFEQGMTIEAIGTACGEYVEMEWRPLYESMHEALTAAFAEIEDAAYGQYLDRLMPPLFEALEQAGYAFTDDVREDDFVIGGRLLFRQSLEKWGTEDNRSRVFWNVIRDADDRTIGTVLTEIPHSHLKFDIPRGPRVLAIAETTKSGITERIRALMEVRGFAQPL